MKPHSNMSYFIRNLGPVDTYPNIYENGDFFLRFSILSTREQGFQASETQVFENVPQSGAFFWIAGLSFVWTDENRGFRIQWCHTSYSACSVNDAIIFLCLTFLCGRELVGLFVCFFWKRRKKNVRFQKYLNTCGRGPTRFSHKASPLS